MSNKQGRDGVMQPGLPAPHGHPHPQHSSRDLMPSSAGCFQCLLSSSEHMPSTKLFSGNMFGCEEIKPSCGPNPLPPSHKALMLLHLPNKETETFFKPMQQSLPLLLYGNEIWICSGPEFILNFGNCLRANRIGLPLRAPSRKQGPLT